jgi:peptidoglycan-associated lipoprotein
MKGKRSQYFLFILCILMVIGSGCSKKAVKQDVSTQPQTVIVDQKANDDAAARAKADRERMLREKALRDQAMKDEADKMKSVKATEKKAEINADVIADIHFDFDKYLIKPQDRKILDAAADWIKMNKPKMVTIEGHCDERGTSEYNLALGDRRANEAKKYLVSLGVNEKYFKTISYGEERPLDPGHNEAAWAKNRRDHFVINLK